MTFDGIIVYAGTNIVYTLQTFRLYKNDVT